MSAFKPSQHAVIDLDSEMPAAPTQRQLLRWMFRFAKPVKAWFLLCGCLLAASVLIETRIIKQSGVATDAVRHVQFSQVAADQGFFKWFVSSGADATSVRHVLYTFVGLIVVAAILRYVREVENMRLSMTMVFYIREAVYDKVQRVGWAFHDRISTGQLINRALSDLQNVRSFLQSAVLVSLEISLYVIFNVILILTISPWLALLALVPLPFWTTYIYRFSKRVQPVAKLVMQAGDGNVSVITENIAGVHVVKAFATQEQELRKYDRSCDSWMRRVMHRVRLSANFQPTVRSIATASHLSLFLLASILLIYRGEVVGGLTLGNLVVLGAAMNVILSRLQLVANLSEQYMNAIVSAQRLWEVLHAVPNVHDKPGAPQLPGGRGVVELTNVTFGYEAGKPVLHNIDLQIPAGSIVAFVGPTGSGKTTLTSLVARFYDPQEGSIVLDGADLREVSLESLRSQVAFVFQETYLFSDTVANNIAYGRPGVSAGEIEAAARLAQAHDFISELPKGYDHVLAERGAGLSGGQKQRLAIARAILAAPRVLILDDATAAIDPNTEALIRRGLKATFVDRTTLVIAHRISTVRQADLVVVVEDGRVTQTGTHAQLAASSGHYREVVLAQLSRDDESITDTESASHLKRMRDNQRITRDSRDSGEVVVDNDDSVEPTPQATP